jgi:hypothetical protein
MNLKKWDDMTDEERAQERKREQTLCDRNRAGVVVKRRAVVTSKEVAK